MITSSPNPVSRAGTKKVSEVISTTPNMRGAISGWFQPITISIVTTTIVEGLAEKAVRSVVTSGIVQPMKSQELKLLPEGQRSWRWSLLHCSDPLGLKTGDNVIVKGKTYRVMGSRDWSAYGYWRFELVEGYRGGN